MSDGLLHLIQYIKSIDEQYFERLFPKDLASYLALKYFNEYNRDFIAFYSYLDTDNREVINHDLQMNGIFLS